MILPAQAIRQRCELQQLITPFHERTVNNGMSFGLSAAGYDVRIDQTMDLEPGQFALASTVECFNMPLDLVAFVHDKSTLARMSLSLFNTVIEPGWYGYLTLELVNQSHDVLRLRHDTPIAQIIFMRLTEPTELGYAGKYQAQKRGPQRAIYER